jgi:hypothetical protein
LRIFEDCCDIILLENSVSARFVEPRSLDNNDYALGSEFHASCTLVFDYGMGRWLDVVFAGGIFLYKKIRVSQHPWHACANIREA